MSFISFFRFSISVLSKVIANYINLWPTWEQEVLLLPCTCLISKAFSWEKMYFDANYCEDSSSELRSMNCFRLWLGAKQVTMLMLNPITFNSFQFPGIMWCILWSLWWDVDWNSLVQIQMNARSLLSTNISPWYSWHINQPKHIFQYQLLSMSIFSPPNHALQLQFSHRPRLIISQYINGNSYTCIYIFFYRWKMAQMLRINPEMLTCRVPNVVLCCVGFRPWTMVWTWSSWSRLWEPPSRALREPSVRTTGTPFTGMDFNLIMDK